MPLKPMPGFLNPAYLLPASSVACERLVNLYPEVIEVAGEKAIGYLRGTPGLAAALLTLPTSPVRGLLAGGTPLYPPDGSGAVMFAVAGSKLYAISPTGALIANSFGLSHGERGDVGDDAAHSPVQMFPNGNQLGIVSAGKFYLDNGLGPVPPNFLGTNYTDIAIGWTGTVTTFGNFVTRIGAGFVQSMTGEPITINAVAYTVATVLDAKNLVLTTSAGLQPVPVPFTAGINTQISSTACPFGAVDVGSSLVFAAGGGFLAVTLTISSVDIYATATLSGSAGAVGSTGGIAQQTMGAVLAASGAYLDSFFVISPPASRKLYVSLPLDGTSWDGADVASKESYPDNVGALYADHEELYVMGEAKSEVWRAPGVDANFPYQRDPGACMSQGIAAPASMCGFLDGVAWIGASLRGQPVAYYAKGYIPERISTHAIEQVWAGYAQISDAAGFTFELDGHEFWMVTFPAADSSWMYDRTASLQFGKAIWLERSSDFGTGTKRFRGRCHCYIFGKHWVGDFATGAIYEMSSSVYQDAGHAISCVRTLTHLSEQRLREFFFKVQLDLETGGGVGDALTVTVEWNDNGGDPAAWVGGGSAFTHVCSATARIERVCFWQLGSSQTGDRVFRITVSGNARVAMLGAYLDSISGT